jgi:hypothetical protein
VLSATTDLAAVTDKVHALLTPSRERAVV